MEAFYHASELEEAPQGMVLIAVVEDEDPLRYTEMIDEVIDSDIEFSLLALSMSLGVPIARYPDKLEVEVEVVRKES